jgi:hypothetical protein
VQAVDAMPKKPSLMEKVSRGATPYLGSASGRCHAQETLLDGECLMGSNSLTWPVQAATLSHNTLLAYSRVSVQFQGPWVDNDCVGVESPWNEVSCRHCRVVTACSAIEVLRMAATYQSWRIGDRFQQTAKAGRLL